MSSYPMSANATLSLINAVLSVMSPDVPSLRSAIKPAKFPVVTDCQDNSLPSLRSMSEVSAYGSN